MMNTVFSSSSFIPIHRIRNILIRNIIKHDALHFVKNSPFINAHMCNDRNHIHSASILFSFSIYIFFAFFCVLSLWANAISRHCQGDAFSRRMRTEIIGKYSTRFLSCVDVFYIKHKKVHKESKYYTYETYTSGFYFSCSLIIKFLFIGAWK